MPKSRRRGEHEDLIRRLTLRRKRESNRQECNEDLNHSLMVLSPCRHRKSPRPENCSRLAFVALSCGASEQTMDICASLHPSFEGVVNVLDFQSIRLFNFNMRPLARSKDP